MALALGVAANAACASFQERPTDFGVPEASYVTTAGRGRTFVLDRGQGPAQYGPECRQDLCRGFSYVFPIHQYTSRIVK